MDRRCVQCGQLLPLRARPDIRYCDGNCRQAAFRRNNPTRPYYRKKPSEQRFCVICDLEFTAWRRDTRCCSPRCSQKRNQLEQVRLVRDAKARPCEDCGFSWPSYVMHFHHLRDKEFSIGKMQRSVSRKRLVAEMAKCVVLCANCHALRHGGDNCSNPPPSVS